MPTGIDQSWGFTDPVEAKRAGVEIVSMYLSPDPSKNSTAAKVRGYHKLGIGVLHNWEADPGRPLLGSGAGREDAKKAVAQLRALFRDAGYVPRNTLAIPFSCDRDTNPSQYPAIDAYYAATRATLGTEFVNGAYGEFDLIEHLHAVGLTDMEWQTIAWSNGRTSPQADFYQESINNTMGGTAVDFDVVLHAQQCGAWWPPGHRYDKRVLTPTIMERLMFRTARGVVTNALQFLVLGQGNSQWNARRHPHLAFKGGLRGELAALNARLDRLEAKKP